MNKQELCDAIFGLTGEIVNPKDHTKEQLEEMLNLSQEEAAKPKGVEGLRAPGGLTRRKMNRGSTRRLARAHGAVDDALEAFAKEIDMQVYMTDEDGNRIAACELVQTVGAVRKDITTMMIDITAPAD